MARRCPLCGAHNASCSGHRGAAEQGITITPMGGVVAGEHELHEYETEVNGYTTTLRLTDEDALKRGLTPKGKAPAAKQAAAPRNKARTATPNKSGS